MKELVVFLVLVIVGLLIKAVRSANKNNDEIEDLRKRNDDLGKPINWDI